MVHRLPILRRFFILIRPVSDTEHGYLPMARLFLVRRVGVYTDLFAGSCGGSGPCLHLRPVSDASHGYLAMARLFLVRRVGLDIDLLAGSCGGSGPRLHLRPVSDTEHGYLALARLFLVRRADLYTDLFAGSCGGSGPRLHLRRGFWRGAPRPSGTRTIEVSRRAWRRTLHPRAPKFFAEFKKVF
jgi:hypothetical protein